MSSFLGHLAPFGFGVGKRAQYDDDFIDRLNHTYSVILLIITSIICTCKQYVGDPMHCWIPDHFTRNNDEYARKICWVSNSYNLPTSKDIPKPQEDRDMIAYYQWIPWSLLIQAFLFYVPRLVWRSFYSKAGANIHFIVGGALVLHEPEKKKKTVKFMVKQVDRYLGQFKVEKENCYETLKCAMSNHCSMLCGREYGNYLVGLYLISKFLFVLNVVGQFFLVDWFLGSDFQFNGFRVLGSMMLDDDWPGTERFPHSTMCNFKIRQLGRIQRHTVQCVLPINFFI